MKLYVSYIRVDVPFGVSSSTTIPLMEAKTPLPHILIHQHIRRSFHVEYTKTPLTNHDVVNLA